MYMALPKIGLPSYHFVEPFFQAMRKDVTQPMRCWREAVNAKYCGEGQPWGKNNPWGREEFDKLLQNYGVRSYAIYQYQIEWQLRC
jgi:Sulfotransferase domain